MNEIVLDLETQNAFSDIGTRDPSKLKVSVVGVYDYSIEDYRTYEEGEISDLQRRLVSADLIIGFNHIKFDMPALSPYLTIDYKRFPMLDIMVEIQKVVGHRVSLNSVARATLGTQKSGNGLDAITYYRAGDFDKLKKYCLDDVKITKDIYDYGRQNGVIYFTPYQNKYGTGQAVFNDNEKVSVAVNWRKLDPLVEQNITESFSKKIVIDIDYVNPDSGELERLTVHIYSIEGHIIKAFSPAQGRLRIFRIENIKRVSPQWGRYEIPPEFLAQGLL